MPIAPVAMILLAAAASAPQPQGGADRPEPPSNNPAAQFWVRDGYECALAAADIPGARFLEVGPDGVVYVSRPRSGDIIALRDVDGDGVYEQRTTFVADRPTVHGMDFHDGWLYFTTSGSIEKARDADGDGVATGDEIVPVIPVGQLPRGGGHWWRSILVTDDAIYTSIGDAGNISDQTATERQKIWRFDHAGQNKTLFASGIRNTEKLRLRPGTTEVWGIDHGSDWFGRPLGDTQGNQPITDLNPPDELNLYVEGGFYGHPFIVGDRIPRYEYRDREDIHDLAARTIPPQWKFGAHWAGNGFCFIDPDLNAATGAFPADHGGDLFAAFHGSWNSTRPVGYCIARILFDPHTGRPYGLLQIVSTLDPRTGEVRARPVDCVQAPDGSVLWSCDATGAVYRIRAAGR